MALPLSRSSSAVSVQPLRHITPTHSVDSHALYNNKGLQRSYSNNILKLELRAEEMSSGGSDIGDEIRRMNEESKERSRQNSIQSSHQGEANGVRGGAGSYFGRMGSRQSSVVDVNGAARWGGYSPGGFVNSPVGSVASTSGWSQMSAAAARKHSASGSSRLAMEPMQEGRPLDSPLGPSQGSLYGSSPPSQQPSRQPSQSSFARQYDQIAGQIEDSLVHVPPSPPKHGEPTQEQDRQRGTTTPPLRPRSTDTYQEAQTAFKDFDGVHFSPGTKEFVELDEHGNEVRRVSARNSSGGLSMDAASLLRTPRARPISYAEPPPADGMVYYPAPVPRMLNLPKRLSQLPAASVQAKRRTQLLSQLPPEARHSAPWLSQTNLSDTGSQTQGHRNQSSESLPRGMLNERMSIANLNNLPPQLRASVFFDHQAVQQDVEIKSESVVATLDSILAASATAPVSAFTDHPFAGDVRASTFAPETIHKRRSTATLASTMPADPETAKKDKARRRSSIGNLLKRSSSGMELADSLEKRGSRSSLLLDFNEGGKKLQKRKSQMSMSAGDELEREAQPVRTPGNEILELDLAGSLIGQARNAGAAEGEEEERRIASDSRPVTAYYDKDLDENAQIREDFKEAEAQEDVELDPEAPPSFVQPSTLLAELQVRKAQQKSRNRTAATHYPDGMHSTLLQLDAVEQINKDRRKKQRIPLAWEDPSVRAGMPEGDEDDDVPLGVLFPGKDGLVGGKRKVGDGKDWDRPLGLMEKRELEDGEPLSSRRNRLQGLPPSFGREERKPGLVPTFSGAMPNGSQLHLAGQPDAPPEGEAEDEADELQGETLTQRLRRLRTKDALDTAIGDVTLNDGSRPVSTFTNDVLSQFGGLDFKEKRNSKGKEAEEGPATAGAPVAEEEETLGQRRARLHREREVSGESSAAARPNLLHQRSSFAELLATNPVGSRQASKEHQPAEGTLLHASAQHLAKQKAQIANTNMRSSSYGMDRPLVDATRSKTLREPGTAGLLGMQSSARAPAGGFASGIYNDGIGGFRPSQVQALGMQTSASTPMFGMNGQNSYFASPTAGMAAYGGMMPQHPSTLR